MTDAESRNKLLTELDDVAYAVSQNPKYGNPGNWFLGFRRGTEGVVNRCWAADHHYDRLTAWLPIVFRRNHEYDLASCLFGMDSALECWVYTLNALGWAIAPNEFLSLEIGSDLKKIGPDNIIGPEARLVSGYAATLPSVTSAWREHEAAIRLIMANHDVSKHRSATFSGGTFDMDIPPHIQAAGIAANSPGLFFLAPMKSVLLPRNPKLPMTKRPSDLSHWCELKDLKLAFDQVMAVTAKLAIDDVAARMKP